MISLFIFITHVYIYIYIYIYIRLKRMNVDYNDINDRHVYEILN
jgi:hypothetical protein